MILCPLFAALSIPFLVANIGKFSFWNNAMSHVNTYYDRKMFNVEF